MFSRNLDCRRRAIIQHHVSTAARSVSIWREVGMHERECIGFGDDLTRHPIGKRILQRSSLTPQHVAERRSEAIYQRSPAAIQSVTSGL